MQRRPIFTAIAALIGLVVLALGVFIARFDANRYKPQLIELVREHTGRTLHIDGELSLSFWPQLALDTGAATLSESDGRGEALRFESGRVAVALRPLLSRQLVIEGLEAQGLRAGGPDTGWRLEQAQLKTDRIASGEAGALELDGQLMPPGSASPLALQLRSNYLADLAQERIGLNGLALLLSGTSGGFAGLQVRASGDFQTDLRTQRLEGQALTVEAALPGGAQLSLAGGLELDLTASSAQLGLEGKLDDAALRLQASATRLEPLALRYAFNADQIDVDRLRSRIAPPAAAAPVDPPPSPSSGQAHPAAPSAAAPAPTPTWPLASIAAIDTEGSIEIGRLEVSGLTIETIRATTRTGGNQLALDPLSGRLNGGDLRALLTLTGEGHALKASLNGVDAGALIRDAAQRDLLEGRGEVSLDLRARGETAEMLRDSLIGNASLRLREGAVKGIDLDRLMQAVRVALDGRLPVEQASTVGAQTAFSSLGGTFDIADGLARSSNLELRADWVTASGAGLVDLNAKTLDWLVRASLAGPRRESPGQPRSTPADPLAPLQGIVVPIKVTGPFDQVRYRVEVQDLLGDVAKREITRRIEEKLGERLGFPAVPGGPGKGHGEEKTLDRLRELFRR